MCLGKHGRRVWAGAGRSAGMSMARPEPHEQERCDLWETATYCSGLECVSEKRLEVDERHHNG